MLNATITIEFLVSGSALSFDRLTGATRIGYNCLYILTPSCALPHLAYSLFVLTPLQFVPFHVGSSGTALPPSFCP
jgi:hypothetical protein